MGSCNVSLGLYAIYKAIKREGVAHNSAAHNNDNVFHHLKLEIALAIPASNE